MADQKRYLKSIEEVTAWLTLAKMEEFVYLLVDNGYDDLDAISQCNDTELLELQKLFSKREFAENIRFLVKELNRIGIKKYRTVGFEASMVEEFQTVRCVVCVCLFVCLFVCLLYVFVCVYLCSRIHLNLLLFNFVHVHTPTHTHTHTHTHITHAHTHTYLNSVKPPNTKKHPI